MYDSYMPIKHGIKTLGVNYRNLSVNLNSCRPITPVKHIEESENIFELFVKRYNQQTLPKLTKLTLH